MIELFVISKETGYLKEALELSVELGALSLVEYFLAEP